MCVYLYEHWESPRTWTSNMHISLKHLGVEGRRKKTSLNTSLQCFTNFNEHVFRNYRFLLNTFYGILTDWLKMDVWLYSSINSHILINTNSFSSLLYHSFLGLTIALSLCLPIFLLCTFFSLILEIYHFWSSLLTAISFLCVYGLEFTYSWFQIPTNSEKCRRQIRKSKN